MDFQRISNVFIRNILKVILSALFVVLPFILIYLFVIIKLSVNIQALLQIWLFITQIFLLEHLYRRICSGVIGEEIAWLGGLVPRHILSVSVVMVFLAVIKFAAAYLVIKLATSMTVLLIVGLITEYILYFLSYTMYMSFIAININEGTGMIEGIGQSFSVLKNNVVFYILSSLVLFGISFIPVAGFILGTLGLIFVEYIRSFLYTLEFSANSEDNQDDTNDYDSYSENYQY